MAGGCVTTLLRLRLQQSTGFLYDCYALAIVRPDFVAEQERYREAWLAALNRSQPELLIVSSDECGHADSHCAKLTRWPALADLLQKQLQIGGPVDTAAYRKLVRPSPSVVWLPPVSAQAPRPLSDQHHALRPVSPESR
jgi:hypothetical protein